LLTARALALVQAAPWRRPRQRPGRPRPGVAAGYPKEEEEERGVGSYSLKVQMMLMVEF